MHTTSYLPWNSQIFDFVTVFEPLNFLKIYALKSEIVGSMEIMRVISSAAVAATPNVFKIEVQDGYVRLIVSLLRSFIACFPYSKTDSFRLDQEIFVSKLQ